MLWFNAFGKNTFRIISVCAIILLFHTNLFAQRRRGVPFFQLFPSIASTLIENDKSITNQLGGAVNFEVWREHSFVTYGFILGGMGSKFGIDVQKYVMYAYPAIGFGYQENGKGIILGGSYGLLLSAINPITPEESEVLSSDNIFQENESTIPTGGGVWIKISANEDYGCEIKGMGKKDFGIVSFSFIIHGFSVSFSNLNSGRWHSNFIHLGYIKRIL